MPCLLCCARRGVFPRVLRGFRTSLRCFNASIPTSEEAKKVSTFREIAHAFRGLRYYLHLLRHADCIAAVPDVSSSDRSQIRQSAETAQR